MSSSTNDGASSSGSGSRMIVLRSSDGVIFEVEEAVAQYSEIISFMIEEGCANDIIPLPAVTSKALEKVIQYCQRLHDVATAINSGKLSRPDSQKDLIQFHKEFAQDLKTDRKTLWQVVVAANFLDIGALYVFAKQTYESIQNND